MSTKLELNVMQRPTTTTTSITTPITIPSALTAHLGTCPTCLVAPGDDLLAPHGDADPTSGVTAPALCPTCGIASIEWALAVEIDAVVDELVGLRRLNVELDLLD